jgi:ribosome-associated protein
MLTPKEIAILVIKTLDNKKTHNIKLLKTRDITILADYFVIGTANSSTQLKTISDEVEKVLKENGEAPLRREGDRHCGWMLIDFGCVVVHLFLKEMRDYYTLERLWADAEDMDINDITTDIETDIETNINTDIIIDDTTDVTTGITADTTTVRNIAI